MISLEGMYTPLIITVQGGNKELIAYTSFYNQEPNENDTSHTNPSKILITEEPKLKTTPRDKFKLKLKLNQQVVKFRKQTLYISFVS